MHATSRSSSAARSALALSRLGLRRNWYPTREAAALLGVSERTLRRRLDGDHWREGLHYRWVLRSTRRTLEVNVPATVDLLNRKGWA